MSNTLTGIATQPPFDGRPCPCCPMEVRNLYAVACNVVNRAPEIYGGELKQAVVRMKPLIDAHFADRMHSHGEVPRAPMESTD